MTDWRKGDKPQLKATFKISGTATDPTAVALIIRYPDGTKKSLLSPTGFASQGNWDADANTPTLADGTGTVGHYYTVTVAGTSLGQSFAVGDLIAYDGDSWLLLPSPESGETLSNPTTGVYTYDLPVHQEGRYHWRYEGFGTVHAADEASLVSSPSILR